MRLNPEVLQAIEIAIQIEKNGLAFYTEAAAQADDPKGKRMFQALARDEAAHLELFEDARRALLNRDAPLFPLSCRTGEGTVPWTEWLSARVETVISSFPEPS